MRWQMIFAVVAVATSLGASQPPVGKSDQDALQGVWRVAGGEMDGKELTKEMLKEMGMDDAQLTFKGNSITWKSSKEEDPGTFTLDSTKKPKHIDITTKMLNDGKPVKGIYDLTGDNFKLCMDPRSAERPTEFKSKAGTGLGVLNFKRDKK